MTPIFLANRIPWFGSHTGYQQLPRYMQKLEPLTKVIASKNCLTERMLGKAYSFYRGWAGRNQPDAAAEFRFLRANSVPDPIKHILHFEEHFLFFDLWRKVPRDFIATFHVPPAQWSPAEIAAMERISSGIVLYQRDLDFFEKHVGKGRVQFIPHGVDVEFFRPNGAVPSPRRILFAGHYLRNTRMLARVIRHLAGRHKDLTFDLLVPEAFRDLPGLAELQARDDVAWHQNLDDDELRSLICSSCLVLLPMNDGGAHMAVLEALACGTPIVTTDVGGIRDYGGGRIFPVVANDDDSAMVDLVGEYMNNSTWREEVSRSAREFAVEQLAWTKIAKQHLAAYELLAN